MLLGSPPDMVHSTLLHRACPHKRKHFLISFNIIQHFLKKIKGILIFSRIYGKFYSDFGRFNKSLNIFLVKTQIFG